MKAYLLAAGFGTRLRPLTDTTPKCLIDIDGKPLMQWWLELLSRYSVDEVLVNTHYLAEQVHTFVEHYNANSNELHVTEFYEAELLGSGGTIAATRDFIGDDENFLICYADNLTDINLREMMRFHASHNGILTMALFHANKPKQCGIAALDHTGMITEFEEKPNQPKSNLASAGIFIANRALFSYLSDTFFIDFGKDVLPLLIGKMYGYEMRDYLIDIGTAENLKKARNEWNHGHL